MKKRIAGIFCALFVCAGFSTPVLAESELPLVVDGAGLLTDSEERNLESKLKDIGESHDMDIVVWKVQHHRIMQMTIMIIMGMRMMVFCC